MNALLTRVLRLHARIVLAVADVLDHTWAEQRAEQPTVPDFVPAWVLAENDEWRWDQ